MGEPFLRLLILVSALGTMATLLVYPTVVAAMEKATRHLSRERSAPKLVLATARKALSRETYGKRVRFVSGFRRLGTLVRARPGLFALIALVTAANTAAAYSAALAALTLPELRATCLSLTAVINAGATVAMTMWIDPEVGRETDEALAGGMSDAGLGDFSVARLLAATAGMLLAQLLLWPGALAITAVAKAI